MSLIVKQDMIDLEYVIIGDELTALHMTYKQFEKHGRCITDNQIPMATIDIKRFPLTVANSFSHIANNIPSGGRDVSKPLASMAEFVIHSNMIANRTRRQAANLIVMNSHTFEFTKIVGVADALATKSRKVLIDNDLPDDQVFFGLEGSKMDRTIIWKQDGTMLYNLERLVKNWIKLEYS